MDLNANDWTAYTWPQHAALEGLTVDHAPAAGAVIVWPQSAGNDTGHVAYVQSVGVAPATRDDLITLQEMNDTTFDDPSQGQGDTMTISIDAGDLARVQVIHAPGEHLRHGTPGARARTDDHEPHADHPAPAPITGPTNQSGAPPTAAGHRHRPQLSVHLGVLGLRVSSRSPAALQAAIFELPSGRPLDSPRLRPGASLILPAARFRLCVSQAAIPGWTSSRACVTEARSGSTLRAFGRRVMLRVSE